MRINRRIAREMQACLKAVALIQALIVVALGAILGGANAADALGATGRLYLLAGLILMAVAFFATCAAGITVALMEDNDG